MNLFIFFSLKNLTYFMVSFVEEQLLPEDGLLLGDSIDETYELLTLLNRKLASGMYSFSLHPFFGPILLSSLSLE